MSNELHLFNFIVVLVFNLYWLITNELDGLIEMYDFTISRALSIGVS